MSYASCSGASTIFALKRQTFPFPNHGDRVSLCRSPQGRGAGDIFHLKSFTEGSRLPGSCLFFCNSLQGQVASKFARINISIYSVDFLWQAGGNRKHTARINTSVGGSYIK